MNKFFFLFWFVLIFSWLPVLGMDEEGEPERKRPHLFLCSGSSVANASESENDAIDVRSLLKDAAVEKNEKEELVFPNLARVLTPLLSDAEERELKDSEETNALLTLIEPITRHFKEDEDAPGNNYLKEALNTFLGYSQEIQQAFSRFFDLPVGSFDEEDFTIIWQEPLIGGHFFAGKFSDYLPGISGILREGFGKPINMNMIDFLTHCFKYIKYGDADVLNDIVKKLCESQGNFFLKNKANITAKVKELFKKKK